jgi:DHA1 family bicyclomycin/chloramphenicol resistance-like MFS transporter
MSIDIMLPALALIGDHFQITRDNDRQLIVGLYIVGLAIGQLIYGPLSDRFGRKGILVLGLGIYILGTIGALVAPSFGAFLAARMVQGIGSAGTRVIATAIVRDLFAGHHMARVMSFAMMVFIIVPVVAPTVGQGILLALAWHWIFALLLIVAVIDILWVIVRLPETRHVADRLPLTVRNISSSFALVLATRTTVGYTIASGFILASLMSYIMSAQQIFAEHYDLGKLFPLAFGSVAATMAVASFTNARLVGHLGMRRVSHGALSIFVLASATLVLLSLRGRPPLLAFWTVLAIIFYCFGLMQSNFTAIAMEPLGKVAGTASSLTGFYATASGAVMGTIIGLSFDGTTWPIAIGLLVLGVAAAVSVIAVEGLNGLFRQDLPERTGHHH